MLCVKQEWSLCECTHSSCEAKALKSDKTYKAKENEDRLLTCPVNTGVVTFICLRSLRVWEYFIGQKGCGVCLKGPHKCHRSDVQCLFAGLSEAAPSLPLSVSLGPRHTAFNPRWVQLSVEVKHRPGLSVGSRLRHCLIWLRLKFHNFSLMSHWARVRLNHSRQLWI